MWLCLGDCLVDCVVVVVVVVVLMMDRMMDPVSYRLSYGDNPIHPFGDWSNNHSNNLRYYPTVFVHHVE